MQNPQKVKLRKYSSRLNRYPKKIVIFDAAGQGNMDNISRLTWWPANNQPYRNQIHNDEALHPTLKDPPDPDIIVFRTYGLHTIAGTGHDNRQGAGLAWIPVYGQFS